MRPDIFNELRKIRNQIAHGGEAADPAIVVTRLSDLGLVISAAEIERLRPTILRTLGGHSSYVPSLIIQAMGALLEGHSARTVCDPWAGIGTVVTALAEITNAAKAFAFTPNNEEAILGQVLARNAEWQIGDPL